MQKCVAVLPFLFGIAWSGLFSDIVKGLDKSDSPLLTQFKQQIPDAFLSFLESDEQQAGQFICAMLHGNIPGALDDIATDVLDAIKDDVDAVISFVEELPELVPEILEEIVQDGEDVVSIVGEIFTNPKGALTVIEGDAKTVFSDITNEAKSIWNEFTCFFKHCSASATMTVTADPAATLSSSCMIIQAAATTTVFPSLSTSSSTMSVKAQTSAVSTPTPTPIQASRGSPITQASPTVVTQAPSFASSTVQVGVSTAEAAGAQQTDSQPEGHASSHVLNIWLLLCPTLFVFLVATYG